MTGERRVPTVAITAGRFAEWAQTLGEYHATPILCVAVGHDDHQGDIHVCVPSNPPDEELLTADVVIRFLQLAIDQLRGRQYDVDDVNARRGQPGAGQGPFGGKPRGRHRERQYWNT